MPLSNLPGPWHWEDRGERGWWRVHTHLGIEQGPYRESHEDEEEPQVPENLEAFPPVARLGGAIGRRASVACLQGQCDLCTDETCQCRHHERLWYDRTTT